MRLARITCFLFFMFLSTFCFAALLKNVPQEIKQPDGTILHLFATGDEFYNRLHDANDFTILLDHSNGTYVYAIPEGNGIKISSFVVGKSDPAAVGLSPGLREDPEVVRARLDASDRDREPRMRDRTATTGLINNLVVFIRFADQAEFPTSKTYGSYSDDFNLTGTGATSMKAYFSAESSTQLLIDTSLYPAGVGGFVRSYQDIHTRQYFCPYDATLYPGGYPTETDGRLREHALIRDAVSYLETNNLVPDGLNLDSDGDGNVDNICFIIQGATTTWNTILWPHKWELYTYVANLNGKRVYDYNVQCSESFNPAVCSHEMSHTLGFPDLYHYYTLTTIAPVDQWDVMESTTSPPQAHLVYTKYKYGHWCPEPTLISVPGIYTLNPIYTNPYSAYKIASNTPGQFYIVEYRKQAGTFESGIPGSGLIIYRVNTARNGNSYPPDEIWIYRPGSNDNTTNGSPWNAFYTRETGRSSIHSLTSPIPYLANNADGGLIITEIGSAGSTISFRYRTSMPKIWQGYWSADWNDPNNWANGLPSSSDDVEITGVHTWDPTITSASSCNNLKMYYNTTLKINAGTLYVGGTLSTNGQIQMNAATSQLFVSGDFYWDDNSSASITNASAEIFCQGDMEFLTGSAVSMTNGFINFFGNDYSQVKVLTPTTICNLRSSKTSTYHVNISSESTNDLVLNGSFWSYSGSRFYHNSSHNLNIYGDFYNFSGGQFGMDNGTVVFMGTVTQNISDSGSGCYFNNVTINPASAIHVYINSALQIHGSVQILSGYLDISSNYTIAVGGNWQNNMGLSNFYEGSSRVVLNGTGNQTVSTERFNILELNKPGGTLIIPSGVTLQCYTYDWTAGGYRVDGGYFTAFDLYDDGIYGSITLNSGTIYYYQGSTQFIDLRGNLTIHGGNFNVLGGSGPCYFSYIDTASLTMDGGTLDFKDVGVYIPDEFTFNENISNGVIRTSKGIEVYSPVFNPTGGTFELYGTADCILYGTAGSNFFHLQLNKGARGDGPETETSINRRGKLIPITRTNIVSGQGTIDINGTFTLSGGTFSAPPIMQIAGNWVNNVGSAAFMEGTGSVEFNGSVQQYCGNSENFYTLLINKSGGALRLNNASEIVTCSYYTWNAGAVDVLAGTFTANDLTQNGIFGTFYNNSGGTINLYQDAGQWIDIDGFIYNYGGTINIYGGSLPSYWAYSANAGITMTSGTIDFKNKGIIITNSAYTLALNVTGGLIRANGGYSCSRASVGFAGGTMELYGPGLANVTTGTGGYFFNLTINKFTARGAVGQREQGTGNRFIPAEVDDTRMAEIIDYRIDGIAATSNLVINGNLNINAGQFDIGSYIVEVNDDVNIWGNLKMAVSGQLKSYDDVVWNNGSSSTITGGAIQCWGNWYFSSGSTAQLTSCLTDMKGDYGGTITSASTNSWFGTLTFSGGGGGEGAYFNVSLSSTADIVVKGTMAVFAQNFLNLSGYHAQIENTVTIVATGGLTIGTSGNCLMNASLDQAGSLDIGSGTVTVHGTYTSYDTSSLSINGGQFINDVAWAKSDSPASSNETTEIDRSVVNFKGAISVTGGLIEVTNNSVTFKANATRTFNPAIIKVGAGLIANEVNALHMDGGELILTGNNNPVLDVSNGNYLTGLRIQKASNSNLVILQNDILLKGNLIIERGGYFANNRNTTIYGYWNNQASATAFTPGTSTVTFAGNSDATGVSTSETFYNLTLNNSSVNYTNFEQASGTTVTVTNILQITDGTYNMLGNANLVVGNDLLISSGAGLNSSAATSPTISLGRHLTDSNTAWGSATGFYAMNSTLTFTGSVVQTMTCSEPTFDVGSLVFNKSSSSGEVHFTKGVRVFGSCTVTTGVWCDNSAGFTHEFYGNLTFGASGSWLTSNNNTIAFKGSASQVFNHSGTGSIRHLTVDKTAGAAVTFGHYVLGLNGGNVLVNTGILNLSNYYYRTTGNVTINNHGTLSIGGDGWLEIANGLALTINNGGILEAIGTSGHLAKVTRQSGNYIFNVESGGTLSAEYATFEYMNANGINLKSGSFIDATHSLHNCTFQLGTSGGTLLTIDNAGTYNITNANFPSNTWSGTNNVKKTVNSGTINFVNATGAFSGAAFESDTYGRINWQAATADLRVSVFTYSNTNPYVCDPLTINITVANIGAGNVTSSFRVDVYYNRTTPPPTGLLGDLTHTFTSLAAGATASWAFTNVSTATAGTWVSYAQVDPNALITEANESNNVATPVTVTWNAIPAVTGLTTTYLSARNQINLHWTASPITIARYNIYYDTDPYGSFSTFLTTTTNTSYMETASEMKRFYLVKAERDLP